jgi:hypothetical protein
VEREAKLTRQAGTAACVSGVHGSWSGSDYCRRERSCVFTVAAVGFMVSELRA